MGSDMHAAVLDTDALRIVVDSSPAALPDLETLLIEKEKS